MDILYVDNLQVETIIGVFAWEREVPQTVRVDLEVAIDAAKAAQRDDIADALDYKAMVKRVAREIASSDCQLVETLAERICAALREEFGAPWMRLKISKPGAVRHTADVGFIIERGERGDKPG